MEAVVIGALLNTFLPKILEEKQASRMLSLEVLAGIESIKADLQTVLAIIRNPEWQRRCTSPEVSQLIGRARELAQEMDYCICRFVYQDRAHASTRLKNTLLAKNIQDLKEELREIVPKLHSLRPEFMTSGREPQDPQFGKQDHVVGMGIPSKELVDLLEHTPPESDTKGKLKVISIVAFGGSGKTRLANQVYEETGKKYHLKAWVHMGLERNVHEVLDDILKKVSASNSTVQQVDNGHGGSTGVQQVTNNASASTGLQYVGNGTGAFTGVQHIGNRADASTGVQHVCNGAGASTTVQHVGNGACASTGVTKGLKSYLGKKRYLIVIDDVQSTDDWDTLMEALPESNLSSRIIVTTTSQTVAEYCSFHSGHVYKMSTLCGDDSRKLFWASLTNAYSDKEKDQLSTVINICDGLPLALIESAKSFKAKVVDKFSCQEAVRMVCAPEERDNETLRRMQWVLMNKYSGLTSYGARACLLYFHMFPVDNPIKRKSLIMRWLAEELVEKGVDIKISDLDAASKHLKTLVDGNIIRPMQVSSNATVKSCILPGTMYEFISRKSISENFVAFSDYHVTPAKPEHIRRLSLHGGPRQYSTCIEEVELYLLRTLAVSGEACTGIMDFSQYKILRVLDLKRCDSQLDEKSLEAIWKLIMLKYLGLPGGIRQVPEDIKYLKDLETLDVDVVGTEIVKLSKEVIKLPKLKNLLGKFRLSTRDKYKKSDAEGSKLETFSGFVTNGKAVVFPQLMIHMKQLRKVKMWCDFNADKGEVKHHSAAIKEFIRERNTEPVPLRKKINEPDYRSLSIDIRGCEKVQFLKSLEATGKLTKLKLHGDLEKVPKFLIPEKVAGTEEFSTPLEVTSLCLSLTTLCGSRSLLPFQLDDGATLLPSLIYLKLVEDDLGPLTIQENHFPSLKRICLVGNNKINHIIINDRALQHLASLHVICEHLDGLAGIQIGGLKMLKEITLNSKVSQTTKDKWKGSARDHPNKPQVLLIEADPKP